MAYKDSDIYLTLFNGRHGSGHGHGSLGSITLSYQGKEIIKDPGRYTYLEVYLRRYLKEEFSHSSLMVDRTPLTQIESSWTYKAMPEPIFHKYLDNKEQVAFEISWYGSTGNNLVIFKRTIIYLKKLMVIIVVNTTDCLGEHHLSTRYQMGDMLKLDKQENNVLLKTTPFAVYVGNQAEISITINNKVGSPKYNEKCQHEELLLEQSFNNRLVSYECFYPFDQIEIEKINCYQNNKLYPCSESLFLGVKMTQKGKGKVYEYYHSSYDTFRGDKLYIGEQERILHGKDIIYQKKLGE
ncbi:heparinase II/III domain-containing protein [Enterococcus sp. DIV0086]|uniref:heparinase II/III domain-containing protein n=1 Tax=Enterococcus sp. DIV0086 TaxID=2774655 RepID=UPI003D26893E